MLLSNEKSLSLCRPFPLWKKPLAKFALGEKVDNVQALRKLFP